MPNLRGLVVWNRTRSGVASPPLVHRACQAGPFGFCTLDGTTNARGNLAKQRCNARRTSLYTCLCTLPAQKPAVCAAPTTTLTFGVDAVHSRPWVEAKAQQNARPSSAPFPASAPKIGANLGKFTLPKRRFDSASQHAPTTLPADKKCRVLFGHTFVRTPVRPSSNRNIPRGPPPREWTY
jgi:hypothetical protein